jgi:uncharacterized protein YqjF (DUF2071 family)
MISRRRERDRSWRSVCTAAESMASDFPHDILEQTSHRPWPLPDAPWVMTQSWHDLLFAHWPIDADLLRRHMPSGLPVDHFDGRAWLGIVPFHMTNVAPRGVPSLPIVSEFPELNVRTYVTLDGKPGVYFFSLDAGSKVAVMAARTLLGLPYFAATMQVVLAGEEVRYESRRDVTDGAPAEFKARYTPIGPTSIPEPGTLEYFLSERYCLYTVDADFRAHRLDIPHPPWPLQPAMAEIEVNTMADAAGLPLSPGAAPLLHFAKRQDMVAWLPARA